VFNEKVIAPAHIFENDVCYHCGIAVTDLYIFEYNENTDTYAVKGINGGGYRYEPKNLILPTTYLGKPVTAVAKRGFYQIIFVNSITVPGGYTDIGDEAFMECAHLESAELPNSAVNLGISLFVKCERLVEANIPRNIKEIPLSMFAVCKSLASIHIPEGIEVIRGFGGCESLTEIVIPDSAVEIEGSAFSNCKKLKTVVIGKRVSYFGHNVFKGCTLLNSATFKNPSGWWIRAYYLVSGDPVKIPLERTDLESPFRASTLLTSRYVEYVWYRGSYPEK
jgi:hypothetical protein